MEKEEFKKPCWSKVITGLKKNRILPLLQVDEPEASRIIGQILVDLGFGAVEVALRSPKAIKALNSMAESFPDLAVGAGTVIGIDQVSQAKEAGASFMVSPGFDPEIGESARENQLPLIPGVSTPTEVMNAASHGFEILKVYPVSLLGGPSWIRAMDAPFAEKNIIWVPSGGIDENNLLAYLQLPSVLACAGSWIAPKKRIKEKDWEYIRNRASEAARLSTESSKEVD